MYYSLYSTTTTLLCSSLLFFASISVTMFKTCRRVWFVAPLSEVPGKQGEKVVYCGSVVCSVTAAVCYAP